jgi:hypothetical protein
MRDPRRTEAIGSGILVAVGGVGEDSERTAHVPDCVGFLSVMSERLE